MQALAEAIGVGVTLLAFLFAAPPIFGFLGWVWSSWVSLWVRIFLGKIQQGDDEEEPKRKKRPAVVRSDEERTQADE